MQFLRTMEKRYKMQYILFKSFLDVLSVGVSIVMNQTWNKTKQIKKPERPLFLRKLRVCQNVSHLSTKEREKMELQRIWNCKIIIREHEVKQMIFDIWRGFIFILKKIDPFSQSPLGIAMKTFHRKHLIFNSLL